mmetsp:Transcript_1635/g.2162  ORF Transcript_1635/g.2162 Transcript_1635/m.2162 type:complete len:288 (+) Transcript_1635:92-955(+)
MKPFSTKSIALGTVIATLLAIKGTSKKSLSSTGAITAWMVGFLSLGCGTRGFLLLLFYQVGTMATKFRRNEKIKKDADAAKSSVRSSQQVLACSGIAVILSLFHVIYYGEEKAIDFQISPKESTIACAIVAHYATCCGDTLASEFGILSQSKPFLITSPWRKVPHGTNGGISTFGTLSSCIGGLIIGFGCVIMDICTGLHVHISKLLIFSAICGLLGSFIDSLLGATLQATYYDDDKKMVYCEKKDAPSNSDRICGMNCLSNAQVNLVSVFVTTVIGGLYLGPMFIE